MSASTSSKAPDLAAQITTLTAELREAKSLLNRSLPALGVHPRGFSQEVLVLVCHFVDADPADWTSHPDVMERRREILIAQGELSPREPA
jgi:hypothetical protein